MTHDNEKWLERLLEELNGDLETVTQGDVNSIMLAGAMILDPNVYQDMRNRIWKTFI